MFTLHAELAFFFMRTVGDAERTFNTFKNLRNGDLSGASGQQIAALRTIMTFNHAALGEGLEHLGEQLEGNVVLFSDFLRIDDSARCRIACLHGGNMLERHQCIIGFF